jgi:nitrite reductase/ring-hydroxylating ferredoxin subunit
LNKTGGFLIRDNVLVAKTIQRDFVAATVICSHEQQRKMLYDDDKNQFHCTAHDARFDATGKGLNNNGKRNLTIYNTQLNGNDLRVFS